MINIYDYTILDNIVNAAPMNDLTRPRNGQKLNKVKNNIWYRGSSDQKYSHTTYCMLPGFLQKKFIQYVVFFMEIILIQVVR